MPSRMNVNPKEHCKAVTLRNGRSLEEEEQKKVDDSSEMIEVKVEEERVVAPKTYVSPALFLNACKTRSWTSNMRNF